MKITTLAMCIALTMLAACKKKELVQEPPPQPKCSYQGYTCTDETVLCTFTDELATVIDFYQAADLKYRPNPLNNSLYFIVTKKDEMEIKARKGLTTYPINLVPCELPDAFKKDSLLIRFSGQQKVCCEVVPYPSDERAKFGCKLVLTKIDIVN